MNTQTHIPNQGIEYVSKSLQIGCAGANLGFGFCKLVLDGAEHSFMSALTPLNTGIEGLAGRKADRLNVVADTDGKLYEAGVDGVLNTTEQPLKINSRDWARTKHYKLLMQAALNRMAATGKRRWHVATGLAADHFKDDVYRADVEKLWLGNNGHHTTPLGDIEILSVKVMPETAGGLFHLMRNLHISNLIRAGSGALLDFGSKTVNWLPFRNGVPDANRMDSVDVGVSNLIEQTTRWVRIDANQPVLHPLDVEAAVLGLRPINKIVTTATGPEVRQVNMDVHLSKAMLEVWPRIEQALSNNLGDMRGKLIVGIGGGASLFGELLKQTYKDSNVIIPEQGQMVNAHGMYRLVAASKGVIGV